MVDTDAFCKLAAVKLLVDAVALFGARVSDCGRLPALLPMLGRGRLRSRLGPARCDALIPLAAQMQICNPAESAALDLLASVDSIDPGEALLLATAAETGLPLVTGDRRALSALQGVPSLLPALSGRIVVLEAVLIALCRRLGTVEVRSRVDRAKGMDAIVDVCFSPDNRDPEEALRSYYENLVDELRPLVLWTPRPEGTS